MKNKGNKKMDKTNNTVMTIERIGESLRRELTKHFNEWQSALEYRFVISSQGYRAKALGMDIGEFSDQLEKLGYIKILRTPRGQKFVFAGDCPWSLEEMQNWLQDQMVMREEEKRSNKQLAKAQA